MCIACDIAENVREKIGLCIVLLNCILANFGLVLIGLGAFIKFNIESRMMLLKGYDTGVLPHFLIGVGLFTLFINLATAKIAYDSSYLESRNRFKNVIFLAVAVTFLLLWFILAGGLMCFSHRGVIEDSLQNGVVSVMKKYKKDMSVKVTLDKLQQQYRCCGSNSYQDWFKVNWVNEEYLNLKHPDVIRKLKNGQYFADDVPFSCCNINSFRPCIHHGVKNKTLHSHYGEVTLYKKGCTPVLMDFFENTVLLPIGWTVIVAFFVQAASVVLFRLLQTSIADADLHDDPEGVGTGYCLPSCPCECCVQGDPMKYMRRKKRERQDEDEELGGGDLAGALEGIDFPDFSDHDTKKDKKQKDETGKKDKEGKNKGNKQEKKTADKKGKEQKKSPAKSKTPQKNNKNSPKNAKTPPKKSKASPKSPKASPKSPKASPKSPKASPKRPKASPKSPKKLSPKAASPRKSFKKPKLGGKKFRK